MIDRMLAKVFSGLVEKCAFLPEAAPTLSPEELPIDTHKVQISAPSNEKLHGYLLKEKNSDQLVIYFHGNWGNIDYKLTELNELRMTGVNVLGVSYRGYGNSEGAPTEKGIYEDGYSILNYALSVLNVSLSQITVMGRSLGSSVAIDVASKYDVKDLILVSPLTSGREQLYNRGKILFSLLVGDAFNSMGKLRLIKCPTCIIHGTSDRITPFDMGVRIFNNIDSERYFKRVDGADHNNLTTDHAHLYWESVASFLRRKSLELFEREDLSSTF